MGPEGLLLIVDVGAGTGVVDGNDLDADALAGQILWDIAGVCVGLKDVVVHQTQGSGRVCGVSGQILLFYRLRGVHMELLSSPVDSSGRQAVDVGRSLGIGGIHGVDVGLAVLAHVPHRGLVVGLDAGAVIDVVGAGKQAHRIAVAVDLPPLVVEVEDLVDGGVVRHAGLAVDELDAGGGAGLGCLGPLDGRKVVVLVGAAVVRRLVDIGAAEEDRGGGVGHRHFGAVGCAALVADAHVLLNVQHNAVVLAGLVACPVGAQVFDLLFHLKQGELALQGAGGNTVLDSKERLVDAVVLGLTQILTGQGVHTVHLIGEVAHSLPDVLMGLQIVSDRLLVIDAFLFVHIPGFFVVYLLRQLNHAAPCSFGDNPQICQGNILDRIVLGVLGGGIVPDLRVVQMLAVDVVLTGLGVVEVGHDHVVGRVCIVVHKVEVALGLGHGGADVVTLGIVLPELIGRLFIVLIGGKLHGGRGVGHSLVGHDLQILLGPQLNTGAEHTIVIQARILDSSGFLGALVKQHQRTVTIGVDDLDAAVLNEVVAEGLGAQVHAAGGAGELAEMLFVPGLLDRHIPQVIIAAEGAAADLDVGGVNGGKWEIRIFDVLLIFVTQDLQLVGLLLGEDFFFYGAVAVLILHHTVDSLGTVVGLDHVEDVGAGIGIEGAAVDIGHAALELGLVLGPPGGQAGALNDGIAGIGGGAVAIEGAAIADKDAVVADGDNRALDGLADLGAAVVGEELLDAFCQLKAAVHHTHNLVLVEEGLDHIILPIGQLGILVALGGAVLAVVAGGAALWRGILAAVGDGLVLVVLLLLDGLVAAGIGVLLGRLLGCVLLLLLGGVGAILLFDCVGAGVLLGV